SQIIQQLSCLDLILSENQNLQPQISSSLRVVLSDLNKTLDLYSSQFNRLLGQCWNTSQSLTDRAMNINIQGGMNTSEKFEINLHNDRIDKSNLGYQTTPTNQHSLPDF
ncbi:14090_t:CDS:2, partial [Gigaspora rosea]